MPVTALRTISPSQRQSCQPHTSFLPFSSILQFNCMAETVMCPDLHSSYHFGALAANPQPLLRTSLSRMVQAYGSASHHRQRELAQDLAQRLGQKRESQCQRQNSTDPSATPPYLIHFRSGAEIQHTNTQTITEAANNLILVIFQYTTEIP